MQVPKGMYNKLRHGQNGGLELGMFCKLPQTASSAPQSDARIFLSKSALALRVTKRPVTDLTDYQQRTGGRHQHGWVGLGAAWMPTWVGGW